MRKANVTYEEVAAYCDREVTNGKNPDRFTGRELQDALGCDSGLATIIKLINQWREEHARAVAAGVSLTDGDVGCITAVVKSIIAQKVSDRERSLSEQLAGRDSRLSDMAEERDALLKENRQLTQSVDRLEGLLTEAKDNAAILRATLATIVGVPLEPTATLESREGDRSTTIIDQDAGTASPSEQAPMCSPLPPEAFDGSYQEPAPEPATGQTALPFSAAAGNSNQGPEEKPHAQG